MAQPQYQAGQMSASSRPPNQPVNPTVPQSMSRYRRNQNRTVTSGRDDIRDTSSSSVVASQHDNRARPPRAASSKPPIAHHNRLKYDDQNQSRRFKDTYTGATNNQPFIAGPESLSFQAERARKMKAELRAQQQRERLEQIKRAEEEQRNQELRVGSNGSLPYRNANGYDARDHKQSDIARHRTPETGQERQNQSIESPHGRMSNKPSNGWDQKQPMARSREIYEFGTPADPRKDGLQPKTRRSKELFGLFKKKTRESLKDTPVTDRMDVLPEPPASTAFGAGVDAPVSAVNAGERVSTSPIFPSLAQLYGHKPTNQQFVTVKCNDSATRFQITPTTTSTELISTAATRMNENIQPQASVLLEYFGKVGVQRPLRQYEHIRSVLNSWDDDLQNYLHVLPSAPGGDKLLEASSVLKQQPEQITCQLYYSQKPTKWVKRFVTLRPDGQVTITKKATPKEKDINNVCHMSDFDIYSPIRGRASKRIKPPKKICFAIKSQQKSNMFESLEDFVHFFSTSDGRTAAKWYQAVQGWRSWYLVSALGEGQQRPRNTSTGVQEHYTVSASQYQLGTFKPLLDFGDEKTSNGNDAEIRGRTSNLHSRQGRTSGAGAVPPSSYPKHLEQQTRARSNSRTRSGSMTRGRASNDKEDETFAPTGLLGRTYSQRQKTSQDAYDGPRIYNNSSNANEPFVAPRPSLDYGCGLSRNVSARRPRTQNNSEKPQNYPFPGVKPLVDLTPQYQPPPQHQKKGKGFYPDPEMLGVTGGLVDAATGPEMPRGYVNVPSARDPWAKKEMGGARGGVLVGGIGRQTSTRRPGTSA